MSQRCRALFGMLLAGFVVAGPVGYACFRRAHLRNVYVVREGVLIRSGQLSRAGLRRLLNDYKIRTVVTFRGAYFEGDDVPDLDEEAYCKAIEITHVRIPPRKWSSDDGSVPATEGVRQFLEVMDDPANYPVLVHCYAGVHRTGAFCALYRMEYDGWDNRAALAEMKARGYSLLAKHHDIRVFLENYVPRHKRLASAAR